jgi:carboxyl-terminal processing protease
MSDNGKQAKAGNMVLVLTAMVLGVLIGLMTASHENKSAANGSALQMKVGEVMELLEREYVDEVDADSVGERLLQAMLSELDPHSMYLPVRELEHNEEMMRGSFEGVGLLLHREGDTTYVGQVMDDGPSVNSGILPGDMIVAVNGDTLTSVDVLTSVLSSSKPGDTVKLTVARINKEKIETFEVECKLIEAKE